MKENLILKYLPKEDRDKLVTIIKESKRVKGLEYTVRFLLEERGVVGKKVTYAIVRHWLKLEHPEILEELRQYREERSREKPTYSVRDYIVVRCRNEES